VVAVDVLGHWHRHRLGYVSFFALTIRQKFPRIRAQQERHHWSIIDTNFPRMLRWFLPEKPR
jgi:hypothetical protein